MPSNKRLKSIVFCAAAKVEADMHTYPTHFHDIEEVKEYISTTCKQSGNQYITSKQNLTKEELAYIKDKVCFVVACQAFRQGEFYLGVGLLDRSALRAAVEADIRRLLPLVPYWPSHFAGVKDALVHVNGVARWKGFAYTEFEGVSADKFQRYVNYNTVRHAFEDGRFEMHVPGEDWRCRKSKVSKAPVGKFTTMNGAIGSDIQKLISRIPAWRPTFSSLNAARDYVAEFSCWIHFSYTYWSDVEPYRFRLIVNFGTAKLAFREGKFKIREDEGEEESDDTDETAVEGAEVTQRKTEASRLPYGRPSTGSTVTPPAEKPVFSTTTAFSNAIDSINTAIADTTVVDVPDLLLEELPECVSIVQEEGQEPAALSQLATMPLLVEVDEDPFKELIAVLKRESIIKAAFE
ncbi:hypothetical protein BKA58DRAFT_464364 [Alternaria rosae]|uniref:uncharacterized protein n=1 Tax=Alternaria rosae TaxID=1187941 RepID=UPI001E8DD9F7|nr:uncharacterized protein BKA58DRAFT_464364 [Alternaria rosae]KAH6882400.1 hypothetical protein BKA58DRAFT_464364 [Alternaria rosae]